MDMNDPLRPGPDDGDRVDPAERRMPAVQRQADIGAGYRQESVEFAGGFDHRSQMMMVGEPQALGLDEVRDLGQPFSKHSPLIVGQGGGVGQRPVPIPMDRIARLGDHENPASKRLEQFQMRTH